MTARAKPGDPERFLRDYLATRARPVELRELVGAAARRGISKAALYKAAARLPGLAAVRTAAAQRDHVARIQRRITADGSVIVPPRIAAWLERHAGVTGDRRIRLRGNDPDAYEVLAALHGRPTPPFR